MLDDKFWVWETLEESVRQFYDVLPEKDLMPIVDSFNINFKGSDTLQELLQMRIIKLGASLFKKYPQEIEYAQRLACKSKTCSKACH